MSDHPNADRLRRTYAAFDEGNLEPLLDLLADDVVWVDSTLGPLAGTYQGKAEVPKFFAEMMEIYAGNIRVEVTDIVANDMHGVVLTSESGVVRGEAVAWNSLHVFSFRDGKVDHFTSYGSAEYQRHWTP